MSEQVLLLVPERDAPIHVGEGHAPPGFALETLSDPAQVDTAVGVAHAGAAHGRVTVEEWLEGATEALVAALYAGAPSAEAGRWFAQPLSLSRTDWLERHRRARSTMAASRDEIARRASTAFGNGAPAGATARETLASADAACASYARAMGRAVSSCLGRLDRVATCTADIRQLNDETIKDLGHVRAQLLRAAKAPIRGASAAEWRRRIREVIDEEYARALQAKEARVQHVLSTAAPREPPPEIVDPSHKYANQPLVDQAVRSYVTQVELAAVEALMKGASKHASSLSGR